VYIISHRIARPITSITKASQGVAEGKFVFDNGKSTGYKEISQLNQSLSVAAKEISKTESLQKELIANISHDLRTPLTIISGYAEMMKDFKDADHTESIDGILNETRRMSELVNDILDLSQIESGAMYHDEVMNLTACVREAIARFSSLEAQGYIVHFDAEKDVFIKADEKRVMQVAYNLISNAINYCGADKAVYVSQVVENNQVKISVRDNGEGIPPESINDIWQRYYKVDKEHKRAGKGTGLGLTIVKGILENYSSDYGVESKPGVGSTFWFTFNVENL
jgi:signal transduction histidine kinase